MSNVTKKAGKRVQLPIILASFIKIALGRKGGGYWLSLGCQRGAARRSISRGILFILRQRGQRIS